MRRRTLLQVLASVTSALRMPVRVGVQSSPLGPLDEGRIRALADAVLPREIGAIARDRAASAFLAWIRDYRPGAELEPGYGFPRLRRFGASPALGYRAQLDALDRDARERGGSFTDLGPEDRGAIVERAIAAAGIDRLPVRPDGRHVAADLMGFYFNGIEANDVCYRAEIGRDLCRSLKGSENRPAPRV